jgi:uncharacterized protein YjeT (DUF2065 family)
MYELLIAIGLVLALEGALYAGFPAAMKRMMAMVLELPDETLRNAGLVAAAIGVFIVWLVKSLMVG